MTNVPSYTCSGDTVFLEGVGCRQACPLNQISFIDGLNLNWTCFMSNGGRYDENSSHIIAGDHCELQCPEGSQPFPYPSTACLHNGEWEHGQRHGCVRVCPAIDIWEGVVVATASADSSAAKTNTYKYDYEYEHVKSNISAVVNCSYTVDGNVSFLSGVISASGS